MKMPHPDHILQQFRNNPGKQYSAADLREYLMVPRGDRQSFKKLLDSLVREGALQLSQKKRYAYVGGKGGDAQNTSSTPVKAVRRRERLPLDRSATGTRPVSREKWGATSAASLSAQGERRPVQRGEARRSSWRNRDREQQERREITFQELTKAFLSRFDLHEEFSPEIHEEISRVSLSIEEEMANREDCRDLYTLCIDPIGARDHDDATSTMAKPDGGWELWVHIADVSYYVPEGGALDLEARDRGFTQYLPWQAVPMLPEELSTGACSLVVNEDRLAFSCHMQISPEGDVTEYRFVKTVVRVDAAPDYEEAQRLAEEGEQACVELRDLSRLLRSRREEIGVLALDMPETKVVFDEKEEPVRIEQRQPIESMRWIEDCMLATNQCCARFMKERKTQGLYRIHPAPIPQDITELYSKQPNLFRNTGFSPRALYEIEMGDGAGSAVVPPLFDLFRKLVLNAEGDVEKLRMVLRAMQKARYSISPLGHFALTWPDYAHFTAPIRRYADLWCHRVMFLSIEGQRRRYKGVEEMAEIVSEREIEVMKCERQASKLCAVWIVRDRVGDVFQGKITGLSEWGMWVELIGTGAEGVVRYEAIRDDWYSYDPEKERAVGRRSHKMYRRGDAMEVRLIRVNLERYELDLEPAGEKTEE